MIFNYSDCLEVFDKWMILYREAFKYCLADFVRQRGTPPPPPPLRTILQFDPGKRSPTRAKHAVFLHWMGLKRDQIGAPPPLRTIFLVDLDGQNPPNSIWQLHLNDQRYLPENDPQDNIIFRVLISLCPSNLVDSQDLEEVQGLPTSSWSSRSVTLWCKHQCERWKPQVHSSEAVDALLKSCSVLAGPARLEQASVLPSAILRAFLFIYQLYRVLFLTVPPNFQYQNE